MQDKVHFMSSMQSVM